MKKTGTKTPSHFCYCKIHIHIFHMKNPYTHLQISMKAFLNISAIKMESLSVQGRKMDSLSYTSSLLSEVLGINCRGVCTPFKGNLEERERNTSLPCNVRRYFLKQRFYFTTDLQHIFPQV